MTVRASDEDHARVSTLPHFIIQRFPTLSGTEVNLCSGGLSGSSVWQAVSEAGQWCVRRWPKPHPNRSRLQLVHAGMQAATDAGLDFTPQVVSPIVNVAPMAHEERFVEFEGHFWEVTSWLPGESNYRQHPSDHRCAEIADRLSSVHVCWASCNTPLLKPRWMPSPAIQMRQSILAGWLRKLDGLHSLAHGLQGQHRELAEKTLAELASRGPQLSIELEGAALRPVLCHFVLRDLWSDHVLFSGDRVTGLIDFGAARIDEPLCDLARLLASLEPAGGAVSDGASGQGGLADRLSGLAQSKTVACHRWNLILSAYENQCGAIDRRRLHLIDVSSTLLSAAQWFQWLAIEGRAFPQPQELLLCRWTDFLLRLEHLPR